MSSEVLSNELFAPIRFDQESLLPELREVASCRPRFRAFVRALREFSVIAAVGSIDGEKRRLISVVSQLAMLPLSGERSIDDVEAEHLRDALSAARWLPAAQAPGRTLSVPHWEDSPLGFPWRARVVPQGPQVSELLLPAFHANRRISVIDPALGDRGGLPAWRRLVCLCLECRVEYLDLWTESGMRGRERPPEQVLAALEDEARALARNFGHALHVRLQVNRGSGRVHDRFVGFGPADHQHDGWHAVSIGFGVCAFMPYAGGTTRHIAVARVPGKAFQTVWQSLPAGGLVREFTLNGGTVPAPSS